jgi:hypothetical protein
MLNELMVLSSSFGFSNANYNYDNSNSNVSSRNCQSLRSIDLANMAKQFLLKCALVASANVSF